MSKANKSRGGARPGAGRKPADTEQITAHPLRATAATLRRLATAQNKTLGQILDTLVPNL